MANFLFYCEDCLNTFEIEKPLGTPSPEACPECGTQYGHGFYQDYTGKTFYSYLYPKTMEQQSNENKKRLSNTKEGQEKLFKMEQDAQKFGTKGQAQLKSWAEINRIEKQLKEGTL